MPGHKAVLSALRRYQARHRSNDVYRQTLIREELEQIRRDTESRGRAPEQTLSRELQQLGDEGLLVFVDEDGHYRLTRTL